MWKYARVRRNTTLGSYHCGSSERTSLRVSASLSGNYNTCCKDIFFTIVLLVKHISWRSYFYSIATDWQVCYRKWKGNAVQWFAQLLWRDIAWHSRKTGLYIRSRYVDVQDISQKDRLKHYFRILPNKIIIVLFQSFLI